MVGGGPVPRGLVRAGDEQPVDDRPWAGRIAVVTGAGSGIGRETALAAAERGATVVCADIDEGRAKETVDRCRTLGVEAAAYAVDVSDAEAMVEFARRVQAEHGSPWLVVNNAGIAQVGSVLGTEDRDWEQILGVNVWGVLHGSRQFGRQMAEWGEGGHIVNVASAAAFTPSKTFPAYAMTKAAVLQFSESLRAELAPAGIGVSAICPGFVDTNIVMSTRFIGESEDEQQRRREETDALYKRRNLTPDTVAAAIVRAVDKDKPVVLVGTEAHLARAAARVSPGLIRKVASVELGPR
jgi:NAD(P)-dependent dehydrogenase (short-subunit alcohol dehydrogenase family)